MGLAITSLRVTLVPSESRAGGYTRDDEAFVSYVEWIDSPRLRIIGPVSRAAANVLALSIGNTIEENRFNEPVKRA